MSPILTIELPFPPKELKANARVHWRTRAKMTKRTRADAHFGALMALSTQGWPKFNGKVVLDLAFAPARNYTMDVLNLPHLAKSSIDGIADALGVNDRWFSLGKVTLEPASKPAKLTVTIREVA